MHKRRNVADHLPKHRRAFMDRRLAKAFNDPDPDRGLRTAHGLARQLEAEHPDAAASQREGLADMFTVRRLGVSDRLARTLSTTNAIESMISVAWDTTHNVKHWRDGNLQPQTVGWQQDPRRRGQRRGHRQHPAHSHQQHVDPVEVLAAIQRTRGVPDLLDLPVAAAAGGRGRSP